MCKFALPLPVLTKLLDLDMRGGGSALTNLSPALWWTLTQGWRLSNQRLEECHAISYPSAALSSLTAHWEEHVLDLDNPPHLTPLSPSLIIDDSIGWFQTGPYCHHVSTPGRLSHPTGTQILLTVRRPGALPIWNAEEVWVLLEYWNLLFSIFCFFFFKRKQKQAKHKYFGLYIYI